VTTTNPEIIDRLLDLLQSWGWETGYRQLEEQLAPAGMGGGESGTPEVRAFFLSWMAVERGDYATADRYAAEMAAAPELAGWALFVRAFGEFRRQQYASAAALLDQAEATGNRDGNFLAAIAHVRGSIDYHRGNSAAALARLKQARDLLREQDARHFGLGRVLDAMGMVYASTSNFHAAREFYLQALALKRDRDLAGEALANGQLGRLCLDWGLLHAARAYFERDLEICDRIEDGRGKTQMASALGQVALAEGRIGEAADWLDQAIRDSEGKPGWEVLAGFAHKDRALAHLAESDDAVLPLAETHLKQAEALFRGLTEPFAEGLAHVDRGWGVWHRRRGEWVEALDKLRAARRHFERTAEAVEIVRTRLEIARTERAKGESGAPLSLELRRIVDAAEQCRRVPLLREAEMAWREADPAAYAGHLFRRARGHSEPEDVTDLMSGVNEGITALFLDIVNSTVFTTAHDPAEVMLTLNQLITELVGALRRHEGAVNDYRGDGFFAVFRDENQPAAPSRPPST
jgi:tetratricopeptide (TPR) repeat protein